MNLYNNDLNNFFGDGLTGDIINNAFWSYVPTKTIEDPLEYLANTEYSTYSFIYSLYRQKEACLDIVV